MKLGMVALLSLTIASIPRRDTYECIQEITGYFIKCYGDGFLDDYHIDLTLSGQVVLRALYSGQHNAKMLTCFHRHNLNYRIGLLASPGSNYSSNDSTESESIWSSDSSEPNEGPWEEIIRAHPNIQLAMMNSKLEALPTWL